MKSFSGICKGLIVVTVASLLALTAWAQDAPAQDQSTQADPPDESRAWIT